ncbi:MAG: hypothetical protein JWO91_3698 [Acidobacteriaceae bacterium]|jgi:hypothetical protein|nr:hypothetical protein [Acidobacteriaceae bacterium]
MVPISYSALCRTAIFPSTRMDTIHILFFDKLIHSRRTGCLKLSEEKKQSRWKWSFGLMATGIAGAAVVAFRGCWHRKMSWPVRYQDCSYQVCLNCGIKRLFDEKAFRAYGPYSYDLNKLVRQDLAQSEEDSRLADDSRRRPAS